MSGGNMNEEAVVDNFVAFFAGGMSSVAYMISITLYHMKKYPQFG